MKLLIKILIIIQFLYILPAFSQENNSEMLEEILEKITEESEISPLIDILEGYHQNPIILSEATPDDLAKIPGFNYSLINSILNFVHNNEYCSYPIIADSLNLSAEQIFLLRYCTILVPPILASNDKSKYLYIRLRNYNQFNKIKGFEEGDFQGSELDFYQRYLLYYNDFSCGALVNKDAGEKNIADFYSGYILGKIINTKIIAGDFNVETGMGNILWHSFPMRKGMDAVSPALQYSTTIVPYRSSLEYNYFRGAALQHSLEINDNNNLNIIGWYSNTNRAANIDDTLNEATSIYLSSYFRTESEISKKNSLKEINYGAALEWENTNFKFGASAYNIEYGFPIYSESKRVFQGKSGYLTSLHSLYNFGKSSIGCEISRDAQGHLGFKSGFVFENRNYGLSLHYRNFSADFRSPYGSIFGESSYPSNETGVYLGFNFKPNKLLNINNYLDLYQTHTRTYYVPFKVSGYDLFSETEWTANSQTKFIFKLRYENKTDICTKSSTSDKVIIDKENISARAEIQYAVNSKLKLRIRGEAKFVNFEKQMPDEYGYLCFLDLSWRLVHFMTLSGRITAFSTDSYDSAIWQYEGGIPGYMISQGLYGDGIKVLIYSQIRISDFMNLSAKFSYLTKNNVESLGSSYTEIYGNTDKRLIIQMDFSM